MGGSWGDIPPRPERKRQVDYETLDLLRDLVKEQKETNRLLAVLAEKAKQQVVMKY